MDHHQHDNPMGYHQGGYSGQGYSSHTRGYGPQHSMQYNSTPMAPRGAAPEGHPQYQYNEASQPAVPIYPQPTIQMQMGIQQQQQQQQQPQSHFSNQGNVGSVYPPPTMQMGIQQQQHQNHFSNQGNERRGSESSHGTSYNAESPRVQSYSVQGVHPMGADVGMTAVSGGGTPATAGQTTAVDNTAPKCGKDNTMLGRIKTAIFGVVEQSQACAAAPCGGAESGDDDEDDEDDDAKERTFGELTDTFNNAYSGQIHDGKKDGQGTIVYAKTGDKYEGQWKNDQPHGEGKVTMGDGSGLFEGRWNDGTLQLIKNGHASVEDANGNHYEGSFADWKKHGKGTLSKSNGERYIGNWNYGIRHGKGVLINPDGSRYEGMFEHDQPTGQGQVFAPGERKVEKSDRALSPMKHGPHSIMMQEGRQTHNHARPVNARPRNPTNDSPLPPTEFDRMVVTDNFAPTKFKSKEEKKAAKKLVKKKKELEKAQMEQEHKKKKQVEALLKAEVKQKRLLSAKMKREQRKLDERRRLQATALGQAKEEQEKYLADLEKQHQKTVREKMKEIERLQVDAAKKTEADKKRMERELVAERIRLQKFEASQKSALEKQATELGTAQKKFAKQQQDALTEQQKREQRLKMDADQQKAVLERKAERDLFLKKQSKTAKYNKDLKKSLQQHTKQLEKNKVMTRKVEGLKKKPKTFTFKKSPKEQRSRDTPSSRPPLSTSARKGAERRSDQGINAYAQADDYFQPVYAQPAPVYEARDDADYGRGYEEEGYGPEGVKHHGHQFDHGSVDVSSYDV